MKVLLINSNRFHQPWPVIPFGLCCVAASLEKAGYEAHILDLCFSKDCAKDIQNSVAVLKPDIVGIGIRNIDNSVAYNTLFLLDQIKNEVILPCKEIFHGPIVIGGAAIGINGNEMLEFFDLEYAVCGDGEACMVEFAKRFERRLPIEGADGLIIHKNGKIVQDPPPFFIEDLDSLPMSQAYRYLDLRPYRKFNSPILIQTKRGCALKCAYCTYNRIEGDHYRLHSPQRIADELEEMVKETKINYVEFTDSVFNIPLDHAKDALRAVIKKKISNLRLHTLGLNPGAIDEELVDLMKEAGFNDVDLGAEAGSDISLKGLGKNYTKDDIVRVAGLLHKRKISINWYLLLGAPAETRETLKETFDTIVNTASKWELITITIGMRVYNGSPIAERMLREHLDGKEVTQDNFLHPTGFEPKNLNLAAIKTITKRASFTYPNFFMADEDEATPEILLLLGAALLRLVRSKQPVWKMFILMRKLEMLLGIRGFRLWLWSLKHH